MAKMLKSLGDKVRLLFSGGFFHIFGANVINKIAAFLANIVIVRFLTQDEYGVFSYANNVYSIALLFTGFGLLLGMFQFCAERRPQQEKEAISWFVLSRGLLIDCVICFTLVLMMVAVPLPIPGAAKYAAMLAPLLVVDYLFQYAVVYFRARKENKVFANIQTVNTVLYLFAACSGAYIGGVAGTIIGRYAAYVATVFYAIILLWRDGFLPLRREKLSQALKREVWAYSLPTQVSSCLNQLTLLLDVFLVGLLLANELEVALYTVATLIPEGMLFVPSSLNVFAAPYFVEHNEDRNWYVSWFRKYLFGAVLVLFSLFAFLFMFAPWIVHTLWGLEYDASVVPFRILSLCFVFTGLRIIFTNLLCTLRAVGSNLLVSIITLIVNVALCFALIPSFGIIGAAWAPTLVSIVASGISFALLVGGMSRIPKLETERKEGDA